MQSTKIGKGLKTIFFGGQVCTPVEKLNGSGIGLCLCHCLFVGRFMSPHHLHQMSQRTQVIGFTFFGCFLNAFAFFFVFFWSTHVFSSLEFDVTNITTFWGRYLRVIFKYLCLCHCHCYCRCTWSLSFLFLSCIPHHSDQMCQRSQVQALNVGLN